MDRQQLRDNLREEGETVD